MPSPPLPKDLRRVVIAAAVGNVIEWYDFYIFGSLAALLATKFFAGGASGAALIKTVGTFTAGFLIRPFGALVFGRVGDLVGLPCLAQPQLQLERRAIGNYAKLDYA